LNTPEKGYGVVYRPKEKLSEKKRKTVFKRLCDIVGPENFSDKEIDKIIYSRDFWPIALRWMLERKVPALPDCVVWPENTKQISDILKLANEESIPVVPFGEASGVLGGMIPVKGGILVDLKRMNKILKINDKDLTVTAQPGLNLMELERLLNKEGYTMGHSPQSIYCSSLGGNLATRAAGQFSTKYGKIDDMLISLEAVLPQGEVIRSKTVPKSSTGPRIDKMMLGSEGTLGIITEATLKIWPYPEKKELLSYAFEGMESGLECIRKILRRGIFPAVIRLYDEKETAFRFYQTGKAKDKCLLVLVLQGDKELVELETKVSQDVCRKHEGIECGEGPVIHWFETRFNVKEASDFAPREIIFDTIEVSVTWDKSIELYNSMISAMENVNGVIVAFAHASHFYPQGVCFYFIFGGTPVKGAEPNEFYTSVWDAAMRSCLDAGGSISHHHGIGLMRARWLGEELGPSFEILKKIKKSLDPKNIMNPGKMGL